MKLATMLAVSMMSFSAFALNCGDTITATTKLTKNLNCSTYTGFAALVLRDNAVLQGNGFKIISPNTTVGLYAEGKIIKIKDVEVQGSASATGVMGYNVERLVLEGVKAKGMNVGVDYYTEVEYDCDRLRVVDSDLSKNNIGAKVISPKCEYAPRFVRTNFSQSNQWAMSLSARRLRITELQGNNFSGSANGLQLQGKDLVVVEGLDLASAKIPGSQIYAHYSSDVRIRHVDVGNTTGTGIELYEVGNAVLRDVTAVKSEVGVKVANEQVATSLLVANTRTNGNRTAGVLITGFGSVPFASIDVDHKKNNFSDNIAIYNQ